VPGRAWADLVAAVARVVGDDEPTDGTTEGTPE
jgi:hypothetical protein